jgi:type I restriction enzyme S subunit
MSKTNNNINAAPQSSHSCEGGNLKEKSGWETVIFTQVYDIQGGTQPPKSEFVYEPTDGYVRLLQIRDFGKKPVPTFVLKLKKLKTCKKQDLLIGRYGASLGRICTGMEGAYNVALAKVITPTDVCGGYTRRYLESRLFQDPLNLLSRSAQNGFNKDDLASFYVPLPPLAEQKIIADKLDELLAQVDTLKARLDAIPAILKRFRQSVLAAAVSGKLTEEWRDKSPMESPQKTWATAREITPAFNIPNNWLGVSLGSISERVSVGHVGKTSEFYTTEDNGIPFLRSQNVRPGHISTGGLAFITYEFHKSLKKSQLKPNDLLVVRVGANRGDACVLPNIFEQVNCANIVFARPQKGLSEYLNIYIQSPTSRNLLLGESVGGAQGVINTKSVAKTFIALPPAQEQTEIVRRVEQLFTYADQVEQQVKNAQARVNQLTQSILAKAFRGELTKQWRQDNPELISGDNSAAALLERIKAERAAATNSKKKAPARKAKA